MTRGTWGMVLALLVPVSVVRAGDGEVAGDGPGGGAATRSLASDDGTIRMEVPADWQAAAVAPDQALLAVDAYPPDHDSKLHLDVHLLEGMHSVTRQPWYERAALARQHDATSTEVEQDPRPHLVVHYAWDDGTRRVRALAYRVIARTGYSISLYCMEKDWPAFRPALFAAADSLVSTRAPWPPRPAEYALEIHDGSEWWIHEDVPARAVPPLRRLLLDCEKDYARVHGEVAKPGESLPVVLLAPDVAHVRRLGELADYAARDEQGIGIDALGRRLILTPVDVRDPDLRGRIAYNAAWLFHVQVYGYGEPRWVAEGEALLAREAAEVKRGLPWVGKRFHRDLEAIEVVPFPALARAEGSEDLATWREQAFAYVALFHAGPKEYREAYGGFLRAMRDTGDCEGAQAAHLGSLDAGDLRDQCARLLERRLRPVDPR